MTMAMHVAMSPRRVGIVVAALAAGAGLVALIRYAGAGSIDGGEPYRLAVAFASSSPGVRARVGTVVSTALAPGESRCIAETAIPASGDATFTMLVSGTTGHAKLDVRATRDGQGWHLLAARPRPTDDGPFAVESGCRPGPAWGPAGGYGRH